ncbi:MULTISPECIES: amino acid ABC transporter ATP-binding protein [Thalassospira]|uniref:ABC transporter ATP-binding protein n=2 Tax=Thalassospira TaxID=168934 RepID=A0A367WBM5_9PROT|nr:MULTISPECIES: amino acid ABC transporter ATP-binding protein [Thalassospira]MDG4717700.1 amino acid ABC transporter ATP-binding protein [Thalassospira sp. FZY0004]RCK38836.1 ABC transporter ATP-binding protein [Thalassospira profundimaris]
MNINLGRDRASSAQSSQSAAIHIRNLNKWYGSFQALNDISLNVQAGERMVICGPSGSGKSTLIRCMNGLEQAESGSISIGGTEMSADGPSLARIRKTTGMVFQQFNLYPHLSILENCVLAPMWVHKIPRKQAEETAFRFLERVNIAAQASKYPHQLSGGQQQRAAIARTLCVGPKIILFDEPTSALDPEMITEVLDVMIDLASEQITMVCVTHEMGFARRVADRVVFMDSGEIVEIATPDTFFDQPQSARGKAFLAKVFSH